MRRELPGPWWEKSDGPGESGVQLGKVRVDEQCGSAC